MMFKKIQSPRFFKILAYWFFFAACLLQGKETTEIEVNGYNWWENLSIERFLNVTYPRDEKANIFDVEDGILIIFNKMESVGFPDAKISGEILGADEMVAFGPFSRSDMAYLDTVDFPITKVVYNIETGPRYTYDEIDFIGLNAMKDDRAEGFYFPAGFLLQLPMFKSFSESGLQSGNKSLEERLANLGFAEARVETMDQTIDDSKEVSLQIKVVEGPEFVIGNAELEFSDTSLPEKVIRQLEATKNGIEGQVYNQSRVWEWRRDIRNLLYKKGYADAVVEVSESRQRTDDGVIVDLVAKVKPGPVVQLGEIRFNGVQYTNRRSLMRFSGLGDEALINRLQIEQGRLGLSRIGAFERVRYHLEAEENVKNVRDIVFLIDERSRMDASLIAGYGSYEQLRGGVEFNRYLLFNRAHSIKGRVLQSQKGRYANVQYRMPQLFGEVVDLEFRSDYLRRQEITFLRKEYGLDVGLYIPNAIWGSDISIRYRLEQLTATDFQQSRLPDFPTDTQSASIQFSLSWDRRDFPAYPLNGWMFRIRTEFASPYIASEVDYAQLRLSASWHKSFDNVWNFHVGFSHGMLYSWDDKTEIPFNKRFFPGGHNSIRGYNEGNASPISSDGVLLGAEFSSILSIEVERLLGPNIFGVVFWDGLHAGATLTEYPDGDFLNSAGLGLRWKTPLGPVRLEYAKVLNPRPFDDGVRWHFSIGFPF